MSSFLTWYFRSTLFLITHQLLHQTRHLWEAISNREHLRSTSQRWCNRNEQELEEMAVSVSYKGGKLGVEMLILRAFPPAYFTPLSASSNARTPRLHLFSLAVLKLGLESSIWCASAIVRFWGFLTKRYRESIKPLNQTLKHIRAISQQHSRLIPTCLILSFHYYFPNVVFLKTLKLEHEKYSCN